MTAYNPDVQLTLCSDARKCFVSNYPTLKHLDMAYGNKASVKWLLPQLYDLEEFCGCKGKMTERQMVTLATIISAEYDFLKISELMLFFFWIKGGHYGIFYGSFDPMVVTRSLLRFVEDRRRCIADNEEAKKQKLKRVSAKECITYDEWCQIKGVPKEECKDVVKTIGKELKPNYDTEQVRAFAITILDNPEHLPEQYITKMFNHFVQKHGMSPQDYLNIHGNTLQQNALPSSPSQNS